MAGSSNVKMDLTAYRNHPREQERINNLLGLIPKGNKTILEIGTRDGYISKKLAERFEMVVALDLEQPTIDYPGVLPVQGDVTSLQFSDNEFDCVLCSEVLEHIPPALLQHACDEMIRVSRNHIIVGTPYEEENRIGRTTCVHCGGKNPPYGHVNTFSRARLEWLFRGLKVENVAFAGQEERARTNWVSVGLMDLAGNPYGTYNQDEPCIHCNRRLVPPSRPLLIKVCSKLPWILTKAQNIRNRSQSKPIWIHMVFSMDRSAVESGC
jgi:Methyltransferase domain